MFELLDLAQSMEITAYWEGGYRCRVPVRAFEIVSDEPPEAGGTNTGPAPTELLLASLASCFTMAIFYAARKEGIELADLAVRTRGHYLGLGFDRIGVDIISTHPQDEMKDLVERAKRYCYVSNTLRQNVQLDYVVVEDGQSAKPHSPSA